MYRQGVIVWVKHPFYENPEKAKNRPALIVGNDLCNGLDLDYLICPLTSTIRNEPFSLLLTLDSTDKPLPLKSEVRCHKLYTVRESMITGELTSIKADVLKKVIALIGQAIEPD